MFPGRARALLLTSAVDADTWVNRPFEAIREQTAGVEHGLDRFFAACAAHQQACGFGGDDPEDAFGDLVAQAQAGDGSALRELTDALAYQRTPDGDSPAMGVNWVTLANDQRYPRRVEPFLEAGGHAASLFPHFFLNSGYRELAMGQLPVRREGAFAGPFRHGADATPALVIGTTHDTFTPFAWARRLVADLGNARLLTFRGDGHDVLTSFDPCVVGAIVGYLEELALPASVAVCRREPPFTPPAAPGAPPAR